MVNEINPNAVSSAQSSDYAVGLVSPDVSLRDATSQNGVSSQSNSTESVKVSGGTFSSISANKDNNAQVARSVREVEGALNRVSNALQKLQQGAAAVKDYPPFPPGNEDRLKYIKSIDGLRKELESLTVPPIKGESTAVFYPRESKLPALSPSSATDEAVHSLGFSADNLRGKLDISFQKLYSQSENLSKRINVDIVFPPKPKEAVELSKITSRQLAETNVSLVGSSGSSLTQLNA